jgi:hypothetical protein
MSANRHRLADRYVSAYIDQAELEAYQITRRVKLTEIRENQQSTQAQRDAAGTGLVLSDRKFMTELMQKATRQIDWSNLSNMSLAEQSEHLTSKVQQLLKDQLGLQPGDRLPGTLENIKIKVGDSDGARLTVPGVDSQGKPTFVIQIPASEISEERGAQTVLSSIYRDLTRAVTLDAINPRPELSTLQAQSKWTSEVDAATRKLAESAVSDVRKSDVRAASAIYPEDLAAFLVEPDVPESSVKPGAVAKEDVKPSGVAKEESSVKPAAVANQESAAQREQQREALKNGGVFAVRTADGEEIAIRSYPREKFQFKFTQVMGLPETNQLLAQVAAEGKSVTINGQPYVVHGEDVYRARLVDESGKVVSLYQPGKEIPPGQKMALELQPHLKAGFGEVARENESATRILRPDEIISGGEKRSAPARDDAKSETPGARFAFTSDRLDRNKVKVGDDVYSVIHAEPGLLIINRPENVLKRIVPPDILPDKAKCKSFEFEGHKYYIDAKSGQVYFEAQGKNGSRLLPSSSMRAMPLGEPAAEIKLPSGQRLSATSGEMEINRLLFKDETTGKFPPGAESVSRRSAGTFGQDEFGTYIRDDGKSGSKVFVRSEGGKEFRQLNVGENYYIKPGDDVRLGNSENMMRLDLSWKTAPQEIAGERFTVRGTDGHLQRIVDGSGKVLREYEWKEIEGGASVLSKLTTADGTIWEKTDGANWAVHRPGEAFKIEQAAVQVNDKGDILFLFHDGSRRRDSIDGSSSYRPGFANARVGYDQGGAIKSITDATGVSYEIERSKSGRITKVTASNGEVIEWRKAKPEDPPGSEKYYVSRNGQIEGALNKLDVSESGIEMLDSKFKYTMRGLDGSITSTQPDGFIRVSSANVEVERSRLESAAVSHIGSPVEQKRLIDAMRTFESTAASLPREQVALAYHELNQLVNHEPSHLTLEQRLTVAEQLLKSASNPFDINQGPNPVCTASVMAVRMMATNPAEAIRLVCEAITTGQVTGRDGTKVVIDPTLIKPDASALKERQRRLNGIDDTHQRAHADQILQNILISYFWAKQGTSGPNGEYYPQGVRYANVGAVSGPKDSGYRLIDNATGLPLKDSRGRERTSPYIATADLPSIMKIAGEDKPFVIINEKTTRREGKALVEQADKKQLFRSEEGMLQALEGLQPSKRNPIVISVTTSTEPFFSDSGHGKAGGSGGQHVVNIVGLETRRELGPDGVMHDNHYVYIDNQWGRQAEHLDKPIRLHDLFVASHVDDDSQLIAQLRGDLAQAKKSGRVDPNVELSLLRAEHARWERSDKYPQSMQNTIVAKDIELSPDSYKKQLANLIARIDGKDPLYKGIDRSTLENARNTAAETLKVLERKISNPQDKAPAAMAEDMPGSQHALDAEVLRPIDADVPRPSDETMAAWMEHARARLQLDPDGSEQLDLALKSGEVKFCLLDRNVLQKINIFSWEQGRETNTTPTNLKHANDYDPAKWPQAALVVRVIDANGEQYHVVNGCRRLYVFGSESLNPDNRAIPVWVFGNADVLERVTQRPADWTDDAARAATPMDFQ